MVKSTNIQDVFLNHIRKEKTPVSVFLTSGYKLKGIVKGFDNFVLLLESDNRLQMVYKHSVSSILPTHFNYSIFYEHNQQN